MALRVPFKITVQLNKSAHRSFSPIRSSNNQDAKSVIAPILSSASKIGKKPVKVKFGMLDDVSTSNNEKGKYAVKREEYTKEKKAIKPMKVFNVLDSLKKQRKPNVKATVKLLVPPKYLSPLNLLQDPLCELRLSNNRREASSVQGKVTSNNNTRSEIYPQAMKAIGYLTKGDEFSEKIKENERDSKKILHNILKSGTSVALSGRKNNFSVVESARKIRNKEQEQRDALFNMVRAAEHARLQKILPTKGFEPEDTRTVLEPRVGYITPEQDLAGLIRVREIIRKYKYFNPDYKTKIPHLKMDSRMKEAVEEIIDFFEDIKSGMPKFGKPKKLKPAKRSLSISRKKATISDINKENIFTGKRRKPPRMSYSEVVKGILASKPPTTPGSIASGIENAASIRPSMSEILVSDVLRKRQGYSSYSSLRKTTSFSSSCITENKCRDDDPCKPPEKPEGEECFEECEQFPEDCPPKKEETLTFAPKMKRLPKVHIPEKPKVCPPPPCSDAQRADDGLKVKKKRLPDIPCSQCPCQEPGPPPKAKTLLRLKKRSQPKEPERICKVEECPPRADEGLKVVPKQLPKIENNCCPPPTQPQMVTPKMRRLNLHVPEPERVCDPCETQPELCCPPRMDENLTVGRKSLPPLKPSDCPRFEDSRPNKMVHLKKLQKVHIPEPPKICPKEECPPRMDKVIRVKKKKLPRLEGGCAPPKAHTPAPVCPKMKRLKKVHLPEPPKVCPLPPCAPGTFERADDNYEMPAKKLPPIPSSSCPCIEAPPPGKCVPLQRLKKVCIPVEPPKICKVEKCPPRADANYVVKSKSLPCLSPGDCPRISPELPIKCPQMPRLNLKVPEPPRVCDPCETEPELCCPPRMDENLEIKRKVLPKLDSTGCPCMEIEPPMKAAPLKRLQKVHVDEPPKVCPKEECPPKMDDIYGFKIKKKKLRPLVTECVPQQKPEAPTICPKMKRLPKRKIKEPPKVCPPPPCSDVQRADDGYTVVPKKLPPLPSTSCPCLELVPPIGLPTPLERPKRVCTPVEPPRICKEEKCPPRADDNYRVVSKTLPELVPVQCPCPQPLLPSTAPRLSRLNLKVQEPPRVCDPCETDPEVCCPPRMDENLEIKKKTLPVLGPGKCPCVEQVPPTKMPNLRRLEKIRIPEPPKICPKTVCPPGMDSLTNYKVKKKKLKTLILKEENNRMSIKEFNKRKCLKNKRFSTVANIKQEGLSKKEPRRTISLSPSLALLYSQLGNFKSQQKRLSVLRFASNSTLQSVKKPKPHKPHRRRRYDYILDNFYRFKRKLIPSPAFTRVEVYKYNSDKATSIGSLVSCLSYQKTTASSKSSSLFENLIQGRSIIFKSKASNSMQTSDSEAAEKESIDASQLKSSFVYGFTQSKSGVHLSDIVTLLRINNKVYAMHLIKEGNDLKLRKILSSATCSVGDKLPEKLMRCDPSSKLQLPKDANWKFFCKEFDDSIKALTYNSDNKRALLHSWTFQVPSVDVVNPLEAGEDAGKKENIQEDDNFEGEEGGGGTPSSKGTQTETKRRIRRIKELLCAPSFNPLVTSSEEDVSAKKRQQQQQQSPGASSTTTDNPCKDVCSVSQKLVGKNVCIVSTQAFVDDHCDSDIDIIKPATTGDVDVSPVTTSDIDVIKPAISTESESKIVDHSLVESCITSRNTNPQPVKDTWSAEREIAIYSFKEKPRSPRASKRETRRPKKQKPKQKKETDYLKRNILRVTSPARSSFRRRSSLRYNDRRGRRSEPQRKLEYFSKQLKILFRNTVLFRRNNAKKTNEMVSFRAPRSSRNAKKTHQRQNVKPTKEKKKQPKKALPKAEKPPANVKKPKPAKESPKKAQQILSKPSRPIKIKSQKPIEQPVKRRRRTAATCTEPFFSGNNFEDKFYEFFLNLLREIASSAKSERGDSSQMFVRARCISEIIRLMRNAEERYFGDPPIESSKSD